MYKLENNPQMIGPKQKKVNKIKRLYCANLFIGERLLAFKISLDINMMVALEKNIPWTVSGNKTKKK